MNAPLSSGCTFCAPEPVRELVGLDQRLHRAERGERRADHDLHLLGVGVVQQVAELLHGLDRLQVRLVHLPVRRDDRPSVGRLSRGLLQDRDAGERASLEELERGAAAGGQVVERRLQAGLADGGERVAAADDRERVGVRRTRAPPRACPPRTARARTRPSGRSTGSSWRRRRTSANARDRCRADVETHEIVRDLGRPARPASSASRRSIAGAATTSTRQMDRHAAVRRAASSASRTSSTRSRSTSDRPTAPPRAARNVNAIAPPDQHRVDALEERRRSPRACRRPSRRRGSRRRVGRDRAGAARAPRPPAARAARRPPGVPLASISSGSAETARVGSVRPHRTRRRRRRRPARRGARRTRRRSPPPPGRTAGSRAGRRRRRAARRRVTTSGAASTGSPERVGERLGRPARAGGRRTTCALRAAEVRRERRAWRRAPRSSSIVGTRRADPRVVGHDAVAQRDVEIDAQEDAGAVRRHRQTRRGSEASPGYSELATSCDEIDEPVRVAPLVVVPADDLHGRPITIVDSESNVHDAGRPHDVGGDDRVLGVDELAGERAPLRGRAERLVDRLDRDVARARSRRGRSPSRPGTGTRIAMPSSLPLRCGRTSPAAFAAPVDVGMMLTAAARARRRSLCGRSRIDWSFVYAWIVVMNPCSMPNASSSTLAIGATQFVVQRRVRDHVVRARGRTCRRSRRARP